MFYVCYIDYTKHEKTTGMRKRNTSDDRQIYVPYNMNIWCQCQCIKSSNDSNDSNNSKWFKIPDNYTSGLKLKHLNLNKCNKIYFELYSDWILTVTSTA